MDKNCRNYTNQTALDVLKESGSDYAEKNYLKKLLETAATTGSPELSPSTLENPKHLVPKTMGALSLPHIKAANSGKHFHKQQFGKKILKFKIIDHI